MPSTRPPRPAKRDAADVKLLIAAVALGATVGAWSVFSHNEAPPTTGVDAPLAQAAAGRLGAPVLREASAPPRQAVVQAPAAPRPVTKTRSSR